MTSIKGRSVFGSIARGKLTFYHRDEFIINKIKVSDPELEYKKYVKAKNAALVELGELYDRARLSVGEGDAQIFVIHQMLITDEQYDSSIRTKILDEHFNADYAEMDGNHFKKLCGDAGTNGQRIYAKQSG